MNIRPTICGKCGNWYVDIPMEDGVTCWSCDNNLHAVNRSKDSYDCHFGQASPAPSEIEIVQIEDQLNRAVALAQTAVDRPNVDTLTQAETAFAQAEMAISTQLPETIRWAAVKEMPGLSGAPPSQRYKNIEALEEMVGDNRRPQTDLIEVRRAMKTVAEVASTFPARMSELRVLIGSARVVVSTPAPAQVATPLAATPQRRRRTPAEMVEVRRKKEKRASRKAERELAGQTAGS